MKLLFHTCCADCLLKFADSIRQEKAKVSEIVVYFYNPNIHPKAEYLARLRAVQKISEENKIKIIVPDWSPKEWFENQVSLGFSTSPFEERKTLKSKRCERCWELRLRKTFEYAKKNGFEVISSTLITSHYQNKEKIEEIGKNLEKKFGIKFLIPKKVSLDLKTKGFYKQNYCGCSYSLVEGWENKFLSNKVVR